MIIPGKYRLTPSVSSLLSSIEASKVVIDSITIPPEIENNIRRQSTLRSSVYSARIEGNELTLDSLDSSSKNQQKVEIFNILKALNLINKKSKKDITLQDIVELHKITLDSLHPDAGKVRNQAEAIFNSAGIAIYMPPPPRLVPSFLNKLLKYVNSDRERFVPVKAALAHFSFEKIHPFEEGNGRVGRILTQKILKQGGYGMKGLLSLEEYLDNHRSEYYRSLEEPEKDLTDYLHFMLTAIDETAKKAKDMVLQKQKAEVTDYLLPRRAEILNIIKEQRMVNFDQLRRRFLAVNERTLRYDLKKLQDQGFIRKLGSTKGVYYQTSKE
ncbi:MAG TPA: Fic family protein [Patescibacteria group bacterium]